MWQLRRALKPHPIAHFALAFFLALALIFVTLGGLMFAEITRLNQHVHDADQALASQELKDAIAALNKFMQEAANTLTQWDEARLQLEEPTYYVYWRHTRARSAGVVPRRLDAVELYDVRGRILAPAVNEETAMPRTMRAPIGHPYVVNEHGHVQLYLFAPFYADAKQTRVLGYAGLRIDLLRQLSEQRTFRYLNLVNVRLTAPEDAPVALNDVAEHLRFEPIANPETHAIQKVAVRSYLAIAAVILLSCLLGYLVLHLIFTKPLRRLSDHIDSMRQGHGGFLGEAYRGALPVTELENVRHSLNDYQRRLDELHINLANKNEELWALAHHDPLTGVFNRRAFDDDWHAIRRTQTPMTQTLSFLLFDCDHFKAINDTYGHQVGDRVIQTIAKALFSALRGGDRLYRLGGDEFATILFGSDLDDARQVAERCVQQVNQQDFVAAGVKEPVHVSIGISRTTTTDDDTLVLLHRQADIAMYHAKRPGQSKVMVYSPELGVSGETVVSSAEVHAVYQAIADPDCLEMHYQPVVSLPHAQLSYFEALARIRDRRDQLIMPASIFPVVELRGLECDFDLAVLERISRDLRGGAIPAGSGVSLNVSGPGIVNARVFEKLMQLAPLLRDYKLVLEITETSLITQIAQASANLKQLREAGFRVALDDFGSGYSSLRYLAHMPVDLVKFDISMVHSLEGANRSALFVEDLARMIKDAGYELVAEGIETEALLKRVETAGFSYAQGFFLGKPQPISALSKKAAKAPARPANPIRQD